MLSPEEALMAAVTPIVTAALSPVRYWDYVPADKELPVPFAALGQIASQKQPGQRCGPMWDIGWRIHLFSKQSGREEAWRTLQQLRGALVGQELVLADPYAAIGPVREMRTGDMNDRLQAFAQSFIDFRVTVSQPT